MKKLSHNEMTTLTVGRMKSSDIPTVFISKKLGINETWLRRILTGRIQKANIDRLKVINAFMDKIEGVCGQFEDWEREIS